MNLDHLTDIRLDRDPDDLLPEDWDEWRESEISEIRSAVADVELLSER